MYKNLISNIKYNYITHLEESSTEWKYLLHKMRVDSLTYIPERYEWSPAKKDELLWSTIPRKTAEKIYKGCVKFPWIMNLLLIDRYKMM